MNTVAYHDGGLLFAGVEQEYPAGWYLFNGTDALPVEVIKPFSNDKLELEDIFKHGE